MKVIPDDHGDITKIYASNVERVSLEIREDGTAVLIIVDTDGPRLFDLLPATDKGEALITVSEIEPDLEPS